VVAVWEGIRRTHGAPPDQAAPLMPPALFDVLDHCPQTKVWKTRPPEPDLAVLRDRALLLVGFFAALRRSELANLRVEEISAHDRGLVLTLPRSKANQRGEEHQLVVLPRAGRRAHRPVTAVQSWLDAAGITGGPVFRKISRGNRVLDRGLHPGRSTIWSRPRSAGRDCRAARSPRTRCAPGSSPSRTCAARRTARSPTRPGTAPWPPAARTCGWRPRGRTTRPPNSGCSAQK
jgi:integrase